MSGHQQPCIVCVCVCVCVALLSAKMAYRAQFKSMGIPMPGEEESGENAKEAGVRPTLQEPPGLSESQKRVWESFVEKMVPSMGIRNALSAFGPTFKVGFSAYAVGVSICVHLRLTTLLSRRSTMC